jgi:hypothetical protein
MSDENSFDSVMDLFESFFIGDLANFCVNVQQHRCTEKRCLREHIDKNIKTMKCNIGFPMESFEEAYVKYEEKKNRQGQTYLHISI